MEALRFSGGYRERLRLGNGILVSLRLLRPSDALLLVDGFERLSSESRYRRFFAYRKGLSPIEVKYFTTCDGVDHFALGALVERADGAEEGIGVARFVRIAKNSFAAEAAVTVIDDFQGHGLGGLLVDRLLSAAAERGLRELRFSVLAENNPMLSLLRKLGATERPLDIEAGIGVVEMVVPACDREVEEGVAK